MRHSIAALALLVGSASVAQPQTCNMANAFTQPDQGGRSQVAVWKSSGTPALLFADTMNINTDGTRRSYSVDDFWGEKRALNNLCNAMSDGCAGLSSDQLMQRRIATQKAKAENWPAAGTAATKLSSSIIPFRDGKPCPEVDGFLVSATALHKRRIADACDIASYADALTVPAIVLPKRANRATPTRFEAAGAGIGDLAVLMNSEGKLAYAVVGDTGPATSLGEVSLALAADLTGRALPPASHQEVRGRGAFRGRGWQVGRTVTLVLPGTRDAADPYMTRERIDRDAAVAFARWGGAARLKACDAAYRNR